LFLIVEHGPIRRIKYECLEELYNTIWAEP
jgi:hypothetical protein